jgi:gliding motility-associated-like protein
MPMKNLLPLLLCTSLLFVATTSVCQINLFKPQIIGQEPDPMTTTVNKPLTIALSNLKVLDADLLPVYPNGFTLEVRNGENYDVNGATITPKTNFVGRLKVKVRVNDGKHDSETFNLQVDVVQLPNNAPVITGQQPVNIQQGENFTVTLAHLTVTDTDNVYPTDFTLTVFEGNNYTINGATVTPNANFTGTLTVPVSINDGNDESNRFDFSIEVSKSANQAPTITGQEELKVKEDETITLKLSDLKVTDPDNNYPNGFSIKIAEGPNYSFSGLTITPAKNFNGPLSVPVTVNDGENDSPGYTVNIEVTAVNDAPTITGQATLITAKNTPLPIVISNLIVTDIDNKFPDDFTMKVSEGDNYTLAGNTVSPSANFVGILTVRVTVNDGNAASNVYDLKINVEAPPNVAPRITGQRNISITQNTSFELQLSHLTVVDEDNVYPNGFTLKITSGNNYTVTNNTITPNPNFTQTTLTVPVQVNDGTNDSAPYNLKIEIVPPSATPKINGQKELIMLEDSVITLSLDHLLVSDADNPNYPQGFSLSLIQDQSNTYTISGKEIRPVENFNGFIEVGVVVYDGKNPSEEFKLAIFVSPVNDPPQIINLETTALPYEPGNGAINISETIDIVDVDNDHLSLAEIGFRAENYSALNDRLFLNSDTSKIRAVYDPAGILFLVGYATIDEYRTAIRSIQYNYELTNDENGNPMEILTGVRTLYVNLHDGQNLSATHERQITMETKVSLDIPNAFTPNGDLSNDTWHLQATNKDQLENAVIRVYNKRGLLIYESTGFTKEWDGYHNGQLLPVDTYYYTIDLNLSYMKKTYKGAVAILH